MAAYRAPSGETAVVLPDGRKRQVHCVIRTPTILWAGTKWELHLKPGDKVIVESPPEGQQNIRQEQ